MESTIAVCPDTFQEGSQERLPIAFDVANLLLVGETPSAATAQMIQIDTGLDVPAAHPGGVTVQGTQLIQTVTALTPGKRYRLVIQFTAAPNKVWAPYLLIECPE